MAVKKMTVRDAYAKAKKQGQGKPAPKGALQQRGIKAPARPQNPSARNKVGVKSKNKPGPWDDIARGVAKGAKIGVAVGKEISKPARDPLGAAVDTIKGIRKDVKEKNIRGLAFQAMTALPVGRVAKGAKALAKGAEAAQGAATVAGNVAKGAKKATKAAKVASKAASKTSAPKVSEALKAANDELAAVRAAKTAFKGPKAGGGKMSAGWAELLKKERSAQQKVNGVLQREQKAGKVVDTIKKVGTEKPRQTSLGSTTAAKKGGGGVPLPERTKAYSKVEPMKRDTANIPLEKNQRYAYEADEMKRLEGKERFWKKQERRMEKSQKNKARQAVSDARSKEARIKANWKEVKAKAASGGPKAKARAERMKKFWADQGIKLD